MRIVRSERLLLTSIHDVSPRFEGEVDRLRDLIGSVLDAPLALLVVPNHWGDAPIVPGSPFAGRLREWAGEGAEIFLHGYFHRDAAPRHSGADRLRARYMTAGEGEFLGLSRSDASQRIADGRAVLEDLIGRAVDGFVAPAWLYSKGTLEALQECAMPLAEDHLRVWSPASGGKLATGPVITWASRSRLRLGLSLAAAATLRSVPTRVMRVGVHPGDCRHPALLRSIASTLQFASSDRRAAAYRELMAA